MSKLLVRAPVALLVAAAVFLTVRATGQRLSGMVDGLLDRVAAVSPGQQPADRSFAILAVNDLYRIGGLPESQEGGLARLRTLRAQLERRSPDLLMLHAGDFLFPSLLSTEFLGQQMVDVMNRLDGDSVRFDTGMIVTFGNHEFDRDEAADVADLHARVSESQFTWLASDIAFLDSVVVRDSAGVVTGVLEGVRGPQLARLQMRNMGGVWVGLFSMTVPVEGVAYVDLDSVVVSRRERLELARRWTSEMRRAGSEFVVALTHQPIAEDLAILEGLGPEGPDLIIGGHEHDRRWLERGGRHVVKADADARSAAVIRVRLSAEGFPDVEVDFHALDTLVEEDPAVADRVRHWESRFAQRFCGDSVGCLDEALATTREPWDAEEVLIRSRETGVGGWTADLIAGATRDQGARAAFLNSGTLRLNRNLPAGSTIRRRHVEELVGNFDNRLALVDLPAEVVVEVLERSARCRGEGPWLQVSGLSFDLDTASATVDNVHVGGRPLEPGTTVRVATLEFLTDPEGDQDGYDMIRSEYVAEGALAVPVSLRDVVLEALRSAPGGSVAPTVPTPPRMRLLADAGGAEARTGAVADRPAC